MTAHTAGGQGRGLILGGLAGGVVLAVAALAYGFWGRSEAPDPAPVVSVTGNSDIRDTATATEPAPKPAAQSPAFDVVRVEPDGTTVIAGTAPPGSQVTVLLDDAAQQTVSADAGGKFATVLTLPDSGAARVLLLESTQDGEKAVSQDQIVLAPAPLVGPETAATPDRDPAPPQDQGAADAQTGEPVSSPVKTASVDSAQPEPAQQATQAEPSTSNAPVAVLRAGPQGVELLQPAAPDGPAQPERVALDAISYSAAGAVQLSGRAKGASVIRVYLDNRAFSDLDVSGDGRWSGTLDGIEPGLYTLRLDEIAPGGEVLSRLETPFKREAPAALDSPVQSAPVRAVTVQRGDTLWAISRDRYGDGLLYVRVFAANSDAIRNPDLIYPGQVFTIPE